MPELKNLHVSPDLRSKGIGTAIIAAAEAAAVATGHATISVGVGVDNPDARRLYERLGYTATGRIETYRYTYVDPDGDERSATETAEYLNKRLHA
ncbi:MAG: GNAT family N-acetyltransferase [Microbacterium chocolatum]|nr:GNAT family N-acetyltransferase [Microbacterium chocolatum]